MRVLVGFVVVCLFMPASAQTTTLLAEDPEGDQSLVVGPLDPVPSPWGDHFDLRALRVVETFTNLTFEIDITDLAAPEHSYAGSARFDVRFRHSDTDFWLDCILSSTTAGEHRFSCRFRIGGGSQGGWSYGRSYDGEIQDTSLSVTVPKHEMPDSLDRPPGVGDALTAIHVVSAPLLNGIGNSTSAYTGLDARIEDRLPDAGFAPAYILQEGLEQTGHLRLEARDELRYSNGEATTYLYEVQATNLGGAPDTFTYAPTELPDGWTVSFPEEHVRIAPGQEISSPILVTVPFRHVHGDLQHFILEARSQSDPDAIGRARLGVHYVATPQPSGHHDTLYLHTGPADLPSPLNRPRPYFNTLEEDGASSEQSHDPGTMGISPDGYAWSVDAPLKPSLLVGLDLDLERLGTLSLPLRSEAGHDSVTLEGTLMFEGNGPDGGVQREIAAFTKTDPVPLPAGQTVRLETEAVPLPGGNRLEPIDRMELTASWRIHTDAPVGMFGPTGITLEPGGWFRLPFVDYHDRVDEIFASLSGLEMRTQEQERRVNPGAVAVYEVTVTNLAEEPARYRLNLTGSAVSWAQVVDSREIRIEAEETKNLHVAIHVPQDAVHGMRTDVVLHAVNEADANIRSVLRMVLEVDTEMEHRDDAALLETLGRHDSRDSPALPVGIGILIASAWTVRRRR